MGQAKKKYWWRVPNARQRGETCTSAKLTEADVFAIRRRLEAKEDSKKIAADYGVCYGTINDIRAGRTWRGRGYGNGT